MPRAPHRIQLRQANIVKAKPKDDAYIVRDAGRNRTSRFASGHPAAGSGWSSIAARAGPGG